MCPFQFMVTPRDRGWITCSRRLIIRITEYPYLAWDTHWKTHSSTCTNVKDMCTCMLCSVGHWSVYIKALPQQYHGRWGSDCMRRFGEQNFFQGGTSFRAWAYRKIKMRSVRRNPSHIPEVRFMIAALTDLLEFFTIIRAQLHLKIAL